MDRYKRAKSISRLSIFSIVFFILGILLLVLTFILPVLGISNNNDGFNHMLRSSFSMGTLVFVIAMLLIVVAAILSLIAVIMVLAIDWKNEKLQSSKILWGLLGLFLLGGIASLIFASKAQTQLHKAALQQQTTPVASAPINPVS